MITIKVKEKVELTACSITDIEAAIDNELNSIIIYKNNEVLGTLVTFYGIEEDMFISQIKYKEN